MKSYLYISLLLLYTFCSCTPYQMAIPSRFSEQATRMEVKGWKGNKQLRFGSYQTTKVKRGWFVKSTRNTSKGPFLSPGRLFNLFDVEANTLTERSKDRFHYRINDGKQVAEVFATEGNLRDMLEVKTGNRWLGDFSHTTNHRYNFSAFIAPLTTQDSSIWQVAVYNQDHLRVDGAGRSSFFRFPLELGYATNGKDTVTIKQIRVTNSTTPKGKDSKIPFEIPGGYELRMDDGVVGIINKWNHDIWIYNDLDESTKLVLSAIASSLLLRRIHDMR